MHSKSLYVVGPATRLRRCLVTGQSPAARGKAADWPIALCTSGYERGPPGLTIARKSHQQRVPGAARSSRTSGSHGCRADQGRQAGSPSRAARTTSAAADQVNTALLEFLISQPG